MADLDLVSLRLPLDVVTNGERSIDARQFYLRVQRIIHLFSTRTFWCVV